MIAHLIFRLTLWFLLTANWSVANIIIGIAIALLLPRSYTAPERLKDLLPVLGKILLAIPQAYIEAFELIFRPHNHEEIAIERFKTPRSPRLIFLDVFLITFKYQEEGCYEVHVVRRRKKA